MAAKIIYYFQNHILNEQTTAENSVATQNEATERC